MFVTLSKHNSRGRQTDRASYCIYDTVVLLSYGPEGKNAPPIYTDSRRDAHEYVYKRVGELLAAGYHLELP